VSQIPVPAVAAATIPETAPPPPAEEPKAAETGEAGTVRVKLTARELCWVDSWRGTQHYYSSALLPGQSQVLTGNAGMRVLVGNAGGVEIEFNGRVIPPAGPKGQVRTLEFGETTYRLVPPPERGAPPERE
jgi:uncharacterized protein YjlB